MEDKKAERKKIINFGLDSCSTLVLKMKIKFKFIIILNDYDLNEHFTIEIYRFNLQFTFTLFSWFFFVFSIVSMSQIKKIMINFFLFSSFAPSISLLFLRYSHFLALHFLKNFIKRSTIYIFKRVCDKKRRCIVLQCGVHQQCISMKSGHIAAMQRHFLST